MRITNKMTMKKLFTSMMLLVCTLAAMAVDYPGTLAVIIDGNVTQPTKTQITLDKQNNGEYTLSLKNFILGDMPVGNIVLKDVVAPEENGVVTLETEQDILIEEGDLVGIPTWLGPQLGPVPVELKATLNGEILSADIDIPLVSLGQIIKVVFDSRTFQLPNSGFEEFHEETCTGGFPTKTYKSDEPNNWHSFMSCAGGLAGTVNSVTHTFISEDIRPGSTGSKSVLVKSGKVKVLFFEVIANGTLTTGRLNAGGTSATSADNNAFIDMTKTDKDANGDPFYTVLNSFPDSIGVWVKFKQGSPVEDHPYATMTAVITDGSYYQEPYPENTDYSKIIVGRAGNNTIESTGKWQRIVVPFEYLNPNKAPKGILVTFSTNADPGQGTANDELYIDDVELIYSSYLSNIKINGESLEGFASDKYDYEYEFKSRSVPTVDEFEKMIECVGSKEMKTFVTILEDNVASILVLSADLQSNHTYKIKLTGLPPVEVEVAKAGYVTFSSSTYALDLGNIQDGKAYIVEDNAENEYIRLTEYKNAVPANTGLIIASESGATGKVTIPVAAEGEEPAKNFLVATNGGAVATGNYVFSWNGNDTSSIGFYRLTTETTVPADKAYLSSDAVAMANGAKVLRFAFGDSIPTAIETTKVAEEETESPVYNIAGQQVGKDYKGIVIKNGKKYLSK